MQYKRKPRRQKQDGRLPKHYTHYVHGKTCKVLPVGVVLKYWNAKCRRYPKWVLAEIRGGRLVVSDTGEVRFKGSFGFMSVEPTEWLVLTDRRIVIVETDEAFRSEYYPVW